MFKPTAEKELYTSKLSFATNIGQRSMPYHLGDATIQGLGGHFDVKVQGLGEENTIVIEKLSMGHPVNKTFSITNEGDVAVNMEIVNTSGTQLVKGLMNHSEVSIPE